METIQITSADRAYLDRAALLAENSVINGGGPFGAVIVKNGRIVAEGTNTVTHSCDPTAHAEVNAIRAACSAGETFSLKGCVMYCSCEPCPMCLGAIYWAGISRVYYGNTQADAAAIDFDDSDIYRQLSLAPADRRIPQIHIADSRAMVAFDLWRQSTDKVPY